MATLKTEEHKTHGADNSLSAIRSAHTLVIKIGSSLLIKDGGLNREWIMALTEDIQTCRGRGQNIILVCSGAVALGRRALAAASGLAMSGLLTLEESQAAAAAGQIELAHGWREIMAAHKLIAAQILLTIDDTEQRRRYLNARATLQTLLDYGAIPVINENDSVATQELRYGDNDRLAARVASMIGADCLLLLSDIDGLYRTIPRDGKPSDPADHVQRVEALTPDILKMAGEAGSPHGSGGMRTKLEAARIATDAGCHMVLASGRDFHPLVRLEKGERSTFFPAQASPGSARKNWIRGALVPTGQIYIDTGAQAALLEGRSLLPVGMVKLAGTFERGDCVSIIGPDGSELGRGLSAYSHLDAQRIKGQQSIQIEHILGYRGRTEIIHRDNLVLMSEGQKE